VRAGATIEAGRRDPDPYPPGPDPSGRLDRRLDPPGEFVGPLGAEQRGADDQLAEEAVGLELVEEGELRALAVRLEVVATQGDDHGVLERSCRRIIVGRSNPVGSNSRFDFNPASLTVPR
jgi:hypothetical protein